MKVMRCKLSRDRQVPRSCHVLNKRKDYCENLFVTDEEVTIKIKDDWL